MTPVDDADAPLGLAHRPGLVWAYEFGDEGPGRELSEAEVLQGQPPGVFRWVHLSLADLRTRRWLGSTPLLPEPIRHLLIDDDDGQRYRLADGVLGCVLHDLEHAFESGDTDTVVFRFALTTSLIVTARTHPVKCAERIKHRLSEGASAPDSAAALDLLLSSLNEVQSTTIDSLDDQVQAMEENLLRSRPAPDAHTLLRLRSLMVRLHRAFSAQRIVASHLDEDAALPGAWRARVSRFAQRTAANDAELLATQSQLRLLRDELDLQATQRVNQNLYILSVLSALLLPATLVTGFFGMNTGGMLWQNSHHGTWLGLVVAAGASLALYLGLRMFGYLRR